MQKRKTKNYDQSETSERGKARTTAKSGRKGSSRKYAKASKPSRRRRGGRANGAGKRQRGSHRAAFNIADMIPQETLKQLKEMKR